MRRLIWVVLLAAVPAFAQVRNSQIAALQPLLPVVDRVESDVQRDADSIRRDTFIHSELVRIANEMRDFQHNVAIGRANDQISYVARRMLDFKQPPPPSTAAIVTKVQELLKRARDEGDAANFDDVLREIRQQGAILQSILFREVETARQERQALSDAQTRIWRMSDALDSATNEALLSMVNYVR